MKTVTVHCKGVAAVAAAGPEVRSQGSTIKLGVDIHTRLSVVAAQHDHAALKPPRRFAPAEFLPWVEGLLRAGHRVHVVYEACGFGFGLYRQLVEAGAQCYVVAPRKLDEERKGVKTDALDATTLCQRLSRYLDGNTRELAVIRVPSEEEERARQRVRQREQLVRHRPRLEAQGRGWLVSHGLPAPSHWWKEQTFGRLKKVLPEWIVADLERYRPALLALHAQILALTVELEAAAPEELPQGFGKLTHEVTTREVCDWSRFHNRRQVSSYTGLCPGEYSSGGKRVPGSVTKHGNPRLRAALVELAWRYSPMSLPPLVPGTATSLVRFQPQYPPIRKRLALLVKGAKATGAARKKAIVAVARQLAVDLWRLHTGRCSAEQLGLRS